MTRHTRTGAPRRAAASIAIAAALTAGVLAAPPATAASTSTSADAGWLRLGHLSPDTKAVDVEVTALRGGSVLFELQDVGYGDVSPYTELAEGTYTVSMVPADAAAGSAPVVSATVTVGAESATTVVAYGRSSDLEVKAFADDLSQPSAGNARIRLLQASTVTPRVDVTTSTGTPVARDAPAGSVTDYAEVSAGAWTLELAGGAIRSTAEVDLALGSVTTLFVLDTADGGLTVVPVLDSASVGDVPEGGVDTGGGWSAAQGAAIRGSDLVLRVG